MNLSDILSMGSLTARKTEADILPGGIIKIRAADQKVIYISDGMLELISCTRGDFAMFSNVNWLIRKIHKDDVDRIYKEAIEQLNEVKKLDLEFRIMKKSAEYTWVKMYGGFIDDAAGTYLECIVIDNSQIKQVQEEITRIADYKKQTAYFKKQAQHDLLTGLLNKMTTEQRIDCYLSNMNDESVHALFIIDIDDFKAVNDYMGHLMGDLVLTEISNGIHKIFRKGDIIGRIGGDEFVVFMKNVPCRETICKKARGLSGIFKRTCKADGVSYKISGSIGIATYPHDGKEYKELYENADKALYLSKRNGKDCFSFFEEV